MLQYRKLMEEGISLLSKFLAKNFGIKIPDFGITQH